MKLLKYIAFALILWIPCAHAENAIVLDGTKTAFSVDVSKASIDLRSAPLLYEPIAAYSNHRLGGFDGSSPIFRIRRVIAGDEQDVYGVRKPYLLLAIGWVDHSGETMYIVDWYDQSGNGNDGTQITAARQPELVFDAEPLPQFAWDGLNNTMDLTGLTNPASNYTFIFRLRQQSPGVAEFRLLFDSEAGQRLFFSYPSSVVNTIGYFSGAPVIRSTLSTTALFNATFALDSNGSTVYANKIALAGSLPYTQIEIGQFVAIGSDHHYIAFNYNDRLNSIFIYDYVLNSAIIEDINDYLDGAL